ncbi:MAG: discoidin domain-containing protein [Myxococcota bacterium]
MRKMAATFMSLMVLAGCVESRLDPDAQVKVSGKLVRADGTPVPQHKVVLISEPDPAEALVDVLLVVETLGLICLTDDPPTICEGALTDTTDAEGNFLFQLTGKDTQGDNSYANQFNLGAQLPKSGTQLAGATSTQRFYIQTEELTVPNLKFWESSPVLTTEGALVKVEFVAPQESAEYGRNIETGVVFETVGKDHVWSQDLESGERIDARLLEDVQGGVHAVARSSDAIVGSAIKFHFRTGVEPFTGTAGAPTSRGKTCFAHGEAGAVELSPCTLTDGDFKSAYPQQDEDCSNNGCDEAARANNWVYVDLGATTSPSLVVVRNSGSEVVVETSLDATLWTQVPGSSAHSGTFKVEIPAAGAVQARYVRVKGKEDKTHVSGITEVSVW